MEVSLRTGNRDEVHRFAAALEAFTRPEPLPWSDFHIARCRALADHQGGCSDDSTLRTLGALRDEAARLGLHLALNTL